MKKKMNEGEEVQMISDSEDITPVVDWQREKKLINLDEKEEI